VYDSVHLHLIPAYSRKFIVTIPVRKPLIERVFVIQMGHRSNYGWMLFLNITNGLCRLKLMTLCLLGKHSNP